MENVETIIYLNVFRVKCGFWGYPGCRLLVFVGIFCYGVANFSLLPTWNPVSTIPISTSYIYIFYCILFEHTYAQTFK